jgi:hypothetical protein
MDGMVSTPGQAKMNTEPTDVHFPGFCVPAACHCSINFPLKENEETNIIEWLKIEINATLLY